MCTPYSVLDGVLAIANLGLDFVGGLAFLIPMDKKNHDEEHGVTHVEWYAAAWVGYKGMVTVMGRSGYFADAQAVLENDLYDIDVGAHQITHKIKFGQRGTKIVGFYCVIRDQRGNVLQIVTMDDAEVRQIAQDTPAWEDFYAEMGRKTTCRRAFKYVPKEASDMQLLAAIEERFDKGEQITDLVRHEEAGGTAGAQDEPG
jgi:recombinational DNA repair protein RecT